METLNSSDARAQFAELVDRAAFAKERIGIQKNRKNRAAIVPYEDVELLEYLEDQLDLQAVRVAMAEVGDNVPLDEVTRALGFDPSQFRRNRP